MLCNQMAKKKSKKNKKEAKANRGHGKNKYQRFSKAKA